MVEVEACHGDAIVGVDVGEVDFGEDVRAFAAVLQAEFSVGGSGEGLEEGVGEDSADEGVEWGGGADGDKEALLGGHGVLVCVVCAVCAYMVC